MHDFTKHSATPAPKPTPAPRPSRPQPPAGNYTATPQPPSHKPAKKSKKKPLLILGCILAVAALGTVVVLQQLKINGGLTDQAAAKSLQEKVAKIMILPNEDALVSDIEAVEKISSQPFFSNAQNGDKLLIFVQAAKIIIYRESTNQIVNAGPLIDDRAAIDTSAE